MDNALNYVEFFMVLCPDKLYFYAGTIHYYSLYFIATPIGIHAVNPWAIPLLGSCVLLASGFVLTLAVIIR